MHRRVGFCGFLDAAAMHLVGGDTDGAALVVSRDRRASKSCYNKVYCRSEEAVPSSQLCRALYVG
jgi:hypothetical protein